MMKLKTYLWNNIKSKYANMGVFWHTQGYTTLLLQVPFQSHTKSESPQRKTPESFNAYTARLKRHDVAGNNRLYWELEQCSNSVMQRVVSFRTHSHYTQPRSQTWECHRTLSCVLTWPLAAANQLLLSILQWQAAHMWADDTTTSPLS